MFDLMDLVPEKQIKCLDSGHVEILDVLPRIVPEGRTADHAIVKAARVSYGDGTKTVNEDRGLIRYLMRCSHSTPFEMVSFQFRIKMPIFCARQIFRHRTSSVNEISGRYSVMKDEFYFPDSHQLRTQSKTNKQGSDGSLMADAACAFSEEIENQCDDAYALYQKLLDSGVAREQARMVLPLNLYTEFYWKQNLHNLLHLLALRTDAHAQQEIRVYADAMLALIKPLVPWTIEAWEDYHPMRGSIKLTRLEVEVIKEYIERFQSFAHAELPVLSSENKREQSEWLEKANRLGIILSAPKS